MSRSVDLFIDLEPPIELVADRIGRLAQLRLQPGQGPGTWSVDEGQVHAELHSHPYVDDGELLFGRYRWALSCRVGGGVRLADAPETALLRLVAEALHRDGVATLLVHDLQYLERAPATPAAAAAEGDPAGPRS